MINNAPVTNVEKWIPIRNDSPFDNYYSINHEAIFTNIKVEHYCHNRYVYVGKISNLEGIEIRWNYNMFENE